MSSPLSFDTIPTTQPATPLLDQLPTPEDLRKLDESELPQLADELRAELLYCVGQSGGHFGAGLGVIELTIALHYLLDTPNDSLVWDVGHQTYPHKILTGRRASMKEMRKRKGLSGFPKREESPYDDFGVGHSSTSISAALGMAVANTNNSNNHKAVAVIGDGAMTGGMAFEALNHAADTSADLLVVLNDNQMSISRNSGGLGKYFAKIWASKPYINLRKSSKKVLDNIPHASGLARRTEEQLKGMVSPALLFEEMGFNYIGLVDGHDLSTLVPVLRNMLEMSGPKLLHITTVKGKGFTPAEADPIGYHAINKIEKPDEKKPVAAPSKGQKFQDVFGQWLCDEADKDERLIGITPAMCEGSGMVEFSERFADRYHDVAIAEQHAVTFAAGLACENKKPVVAIYSTFLQRAYDQLIHDVALQNLDVTFGIDRAGLVGEDGPTHAGSFDLSYLRCIPNMIVAAPSDENEARQLLHTAYHYSGPAAVRYPRGKGPGATISEELSLLPIGKGVTVRDGHRVAILNFGTLLSSALKVAEKNDYSVADMRFVKPLDESLIKQLLESHDLLVTLEENVIQGGAGSAVCEYSNQIAANTPILQLGLPDSFINHGTHNELLASCGLNSAGIDARITERLNQLSSTTVTA